LKHERTAHRDDAFVFFAERLKSAGIRTGTYREVSGYFFLITPRARRKEEDGLVELHALVFVPLHALWWLLRRSRNGLGEEYGRSIQSERSRQAQATLYATHADSFFGFDGHVVGLG